VKDQFQHHLLVPEYHAIHPKQKRVISAVVNNRVNLINGLRLVLAVIRVAMVFLSVLVVLLK